jgi:hypothetical protein
MSTEKKHGRPDGPLQRLNRALTEVGVEHFDDDRDWDERVKLPEWQLARLKRRYEERKKGNRGTPGESD